MSKRTAIPFSLVCVFSLCNAAWSDEAGTRLSKEELMSFLPGTKVTHVIKGGSTHMWVNEADGKFIASSDGKTITLVGGRSYNANGTWRVSEDGRYCVNIDWRRRAENWCLFLYKKTGGGYYMTDSEDPGAERQAIELTR